MRYDPNIGVFGMDVTVVIKRPGERVCKRRIATKKIPARHKLTVEDAVSFLNESYGVEVV
jgi:large subunit ribosomal protein L5